MPVDRSGGTLKLQKSADKGAILFGVVKSYTVPTEENESIDFSDDPLFTGTITISRTDLKTYTLPDDAGGIIIATYYNRADRVPELFNLSIPGTEGEINSQIREVSENVEELDNSKIDVDA